MAEEQHTTQHGTPLDEAEMRHRLRLAAHDLRSLLGPIIGYADLIRHSADLDKARPYAERIATAAEKVEEFADRLADRCLGAEHPGGNTTPGTDNSSGSAASGR